MKKLIYIDTTFNSTCKTLKEKRYAEEHGNLNMKTVLVPIKENFSKPNLIPWITVNGKLVRQHV